MKKLFLLAAVALSLSLTAQAKGGDIDYKPTPYMFVGIQGGAQTTFTDYDQLKLITPTASVSFGAFFTPVVGARLHVNGIWNKGGIDPDFTYKYSYVTSNLDLMLNLVTLFGRKDYSPLNVYLIGGIGLSCAWGNDDLTGSIYNQPMAWEDNLLSHNARVGAMLDYNIAKHWSINLEVSANSLSDRFNSKISQKDDWQLTAQLGVAYKFGFRKKVHTQPVVVTPVEEFAGDRNAETVPAKPEVETPAPTPVPPKQPESIQRDVFFAIARSDIDNNSSSTKIQEVIDFMKAHPDAKATVVGHADAGTGNPRINARYAADRARRVTEALVKGGIPASRITTDSKGDTVMPYGDNEQSRVAIIIASEK